MKALKFLIILITISLLVVVAISISSVVNKFNQLGSYDLENQSEYFKSPKFTALNLRTSKFDSINLEGVQIVNFWASWCKPCLEEMPDLIYLKNKYPSFKIMLLSNDSVVQQSKYLTIHDKNNLPAYFISDSGIQIPDVLPTTLVLRDSIILKEYVGLQNWTDTSITNYLDSLKNTFRIKI